MGTGKVDKGEGSVEGEVWRGSARNLCAVAPVLSSGSDGNSPAFTVNLHPNTLPSRPAVGGSIQNPNTRAAAIVSDRPVIRDRFA